VRMTWLQQLTTCMYSVSSGVRCGLRVQETQVAVQETEKEKGEGNEQEQLT